MAGQPGALATREWLGQELSLSSLALRDRAYAFLVERGSASDDELLGHVFGGTPPRGVRDQLLEPLLGDARLQRTPLGWSLARPGPLDADLRTLAITALAIAATGPRPARHRLLGLAALHTQHGHVVARFGAAFNPGARVPGYVAERARFDRETLDELPSFEAIVDDLLAFLGRRPVVAQEARATWAFVEHEARRVGRRPLTPTLIDINALADLVLDLPGKPSLPSVARRLGIGVVHVGEPDDEARVLAETSMGLLKLAEASGLRTLAALELALQSSASAAAAPLRQSSTPRKLPDAPGVYRLRGAHDEVLYVGKARRLRARLADYVHRPLGATRRLEGLADAVSAIDTTECGSDLQALILEDREIRRLSPRYNTARHLRAPRVWLRLTSGERQTPRLRLAGAPSPDDPPDAVLGPFRNAAAAAAARNLARDLFELDRLRRSADRATYLRAVQDAWAFLGGYDAARTQAQAQVRSQLARVGDFARRRSLERLLRAALAYDVHSLLLPADPRQSRYAVVRPAPEAGVVEVFVVDAGILVGQARVPPDDVAGVLDRPTPATEEADRDVVLRWLGGQRAPARLVLLADRGLDALRAAIVELLATRDA